MAKSNHLTAPLPVKPFAQPLLGKHSSRPGAMKTIWGRIKSKGLKDEKGNIHVGKDPELAAIFQGKKTIKNTDVMKGISHSLIKAPK